MSRQQVLLDKDLYEACEEGATDRVQSLLKSGAAPGGYEAPQRDEVLLGIRSVSG